MGFTKVKKKGQFNFRDKVLKQIPADSISDNLYAEGNKAYQTLRLAANVADTETFTIGDDVYEIEQVNTDTNKNVADEDAAAIDAVSNPVQITMEDDAHGVEAGNLIRIGDEIMKVTLVEDEVITAIRGWSGTTIGTHVKNSDVYKGGGYTATNIPVGIGATLTPAVASVAIPATINDEGTEDFTAIKLSDNIVLLTANTVGARTTATTETFGQANNVWLGDTVVGGAAAGPRRMAAYVHEATAEEATLGKIYFPVEWEPSAAVVQVTATSTDRVKAWDGAWSFETGATNAQPWRVEIDNGGSSDWAAGDTIYALFFE